ncbi:hypothetical protein HH212_14055 [Massilia forsythiae]|uniref:Uncharacterized protein n=1 Tax=Massilia forsythiae TaxID=2728020 RepID=A0A7Z2ZSZ1_9BURK|nr:hypothetical protein [Massilia forsythiae]QJE01016.1 hypothetical protein HH212_14055 [Massilia forsythiae]
MRTIPDDVLDLIAGGRKVSTWNSWTTSITIVGHAEPEPWYPGDAGGGAWGGYGNGDGNSDAGGGGGVAGDYGVGQHHASPVPEFAPANVHIDTVRNVVLEAATQIKALANLDGNEHGCMIVRTGEGTLKVGPISSGDFDSVTTGYTLQPGDTVVAWVHDHPYDFSIDQSRPSRHDIDSYRDMLSQPRVDPNALMYIVDMKSGDSFEYHKGSRFDKPGADISKDF